MEFTKYTNELLSLVQQEGGDNPTFYKGSFEDQYGDIHDWQTGVVTQHYLCRQLYLHYNQTVRLNCPREGGGGGREGEGEREGEEGGREGGEGGKGGGKKEEGREGGRREDMARLTGDNVI